MANTPLPPMGPVPNRSTNPQASPPAAAPVTDDQQQTQYVYVTRPLDPEQPVMSEEVKRRHEESKRAYSRLNLSKGEYVISAVMRHPIGLLRIWAVVLVFVLFDFMVAWQMVGFMSDASLSASGTSSDILIYAAATLVAALGFIGGIAATFIYNNNYFFLTNESVIQEMQISLFAKHEQTVSLANIEDASFQQSGILPTLLNYGMIRLSTEGDETTYRFSYVANPKRQVAILNNAVEAFKNGRPVLGDED